MKNPYTMIVDGRPLQEIVIAIANRNESDLAGLAENLNDSQLISIADWTSASIHKREVESTLITGAILLGFTIATVGESRKEIFDLLLADLELSQSQAYRCINAFRCFGKTLLADEKLRQAFVVESLKLLSEPRSTEEARQAALELASNGERITIKTAKALLPREVDQESGTTTTPTRSGANPFTKAMSLVEKLKAEVYYPRKPLEHKEFDRLIDRLEQIICRLRAKQGVAISVAKSKTKTKEVANV